LHKGIITAVKRVEFVSGRMSYIIQRGRWCHIIIEEDEMGGACSTNEERMNTYRLLVGKPEGKRPLGRPRRRWVDNTRMDLVEVGWAWTELVWLGIGTVGELL
jgi:hypothetical protein